MNTPAEYVIKKFGGIASTARIVGRTRQAVWKWKQPVATGGTRGRIPGKLHLLILSAARQRGIPLTAFDLTYGHK